MTSVAALDLVQFKWILQGNTWNFILNYGEWYEDMIGHCSYAQNSSSCKFTRKALPTEFLENIFPYGLISLSFVSKFISHIFIEWIYLSTDGPGQRQVTSVPERARSGRPILTARDYPMCAARKAGLLRHRPLLAIACLKPWRTRCESKLWD